MCKNAQYGGAMMNWGDLKLFLAVARTGSISGGAQATGAALHGI